MKSKKLRRGGVSREDAKERGGASREDAKERQEYKGSNQIIRRCIQPRQGRNVSSSIDAMCTPCIKPRRGGMLKEDGSQDE